MDFSAIAHDLRTPLNVMLGHMHLLAVEPLSDRARQRLCVLERQIRRMMRLLDGCDEERQITSLAAVDLAAVIRDAISELDAVFERQGIEIASNIPVDLALVRGDTDLLHRLIVNLLTNATESIAGRGRVEIASRATRDAHADGERICIEITDTGKGIAAVCLPQVFEDGFTTKLHSHHRGLGLSICREIVRIHGGQIGLSSVPGIGTTVRVSLPVNI